MDDGANTLQNLKGIFKEIYNDKPIDVVKSTTQEGRRFKRIRKLLENKKKEMGVKDPGK
jgi:hypothetical protein